MCVRVGVYVSGEICTIVACSWSFFCFSTFRYDNDEGQPTRNVTESLVRSDMFFPLPASCHSLICGFLAQFSSVKKRYIRESF